MADPALLTRPVHELAGLVRSGEVAATELVEASVARIEARDDELHAFLEVDGERALAEARAIGAGDGRPFAGVPIAIKNNRPAAGWRLTLACDLFGDLVPNFDHAVVARLRAAGFVIVGTTNLPEYGILPVSEPRRFPATRNPWDTSRTPGGSSGGSAAAVAAGMVPVAHGNDGGGSTRIPAACCGLVGLKPTRGRISQAPILGDHPLVTDGVLTRTVADTAALLDVMAGYELGDATWATPPAEPFAASAAREPGRLRIGVCTVAPLPGAEVDAECLGAVEDAAKLLVELGHDVETFDPGWQDPAMLPLFSAQFMSGIALSVHISGVVAGRDPRREDMQSLSWAIYERIRTTGALDIATAADELSTRMRALITAMDPYDAVLTPALAQRPLPIGALDADAEDPFATFAASGAFTPFTAICNASGQPAISLPLRQGDDGLPTGVQLIGRPAREDVLLSLSAQIEAARPWADRLAPGVAG